MSDLDPRLSCQFGCDPYTDRARSHVSDGVRAGALLSFGPARSNPSQEIPVHRTTIPIIVAALLAVPTLARAEEPEPAKDDEASPAGSDDAAGAADTDEAEDDEEADDILLVLDLPIVAATAAATLPSEEVKVALTAAHDAGLSAGAAADLLECETETVEEKGVREGYGRWLSWKLSEGKRGEDLKKEIRARGDAFKGLSDEEKEAMKEKLKEAHEKEMERRKALREKWAAARKDGKKVPIRAKKRHAKRKAALVAQVAELRRAHAAGATHGGARGPGGKGGDAPGRDIAEAKRDMADAKRGGPGPKDEGDDGAQAREAKGDKAGAKPGKPQAHPGHGKDKPKPTSNEGKASAGGKGKGPKGPKTGGKKNLDNKAGK